MLPDQSAIPVKPRVQLPVGITTSPRPRIEWKSSLGAERWQVQVCGANSADCGEIFWTSAELPGSSRFTFPDADLPSHTSLAVRVRAHLDGHWEEWGIASICRIEPVLPLAEGIVLYDLNYTRELSPLQAFAHAHLVTALQGLVNRVTPTLYVKFARGNPQYANADLMPQGDIDQFWLDRFRHPCGWLGESLVRTIPDLEELLEHFRDSFTGVVLWDTSVPATSNVASTVAGAENLLPVPCCNDTSSLYRDIVVGGLQLPVTVDLRGKFTGRDTIPDINRPSSGSAKCDAYLWALDRYLATGKSNSCYMGHYIDAWWVRNPAPGGDWQNHTLTNHDYFIAQRGFFWDLDVWDDEAPVDDPGQKPGTDAATLREIFSCANRMLDNREMIHVGGFTPWAFKYTNFPGAGGGHDPVATEWELARVLSSYNAYVDADALGLSALVNASFLCYYPLPSSYAPVLAFTPDELVAENLLMPDLLPAARNFLLNYIGDYDSAAWAWNSLSLIWETEGRGDVPMAWAINPNLADRVAPLFEHIYRTRTANDHFMTGDSGAGYVNPTQLQGVRSPSGLPDATEVWSYHCLQWYRKFGLRFTGFLINGHSGVITPEAERMYLPLSPDGIVNQYGHSQDRLHLVNQRMPAFELESDLDNLKDAVPFIKQRSRERGDPPRFMVFRQILKDAAYYKEMLKQLQSALDVPPAFCDPHTFGCLARAHLRGNNDDQAMLLFEATPVRVKSGDLLCGDVVMRNDGWNAWEPATHALQLELVRPGAGDSVWCREIPVPQDIHPGEAVLFSLKETLPDFCGEYCLVIDMARNGTGFSSRGGYQTEKQINILSASVALA